MSKEALGTIGQTTFFTPEELQQWATKERESWTWITRPPERIPGAKHLVQHLTSLEADIGPRLDKLKANLNPESAREVLGHLKPIYARGDLLYSWSAEMQFVASLRNDIPPDATNEQKESARCVAAGAYSIFLRKPLSDWQVDAFRGAVRAEFFRAGIDGSFRAEREAFTTLMTELDSRVNAANVNFTTVESRFQDAFRRLKEQGDKQQAEFVAAEQARKEQHDKFVATYGEHMRLQAPVKYWTAKREHHLKRRFWFAVALCVWIVVAVASFVGVWHFGYKDAISTLNAQSQNGTDTTKAVDIENIAAFAHYFGLLAFVLVAVVWITRLLVRMFLTHLHFESDAHERVVMAETFISLVNDQKVTEKDDRQLVLQALFRHVGDGLVKDDALPEILSAINRAATGKS